ncbi:MAG: DedA family protein [bacterium]
MEEFILKIQALDPIWVYAVVFAFAYIENIFPPSPSDTVIVVAGTLVGMERVGFVETLLIATLGSTLGFMTMYKLGDWFGIRILEQGKIKFIPIESVKKVEAWFRKYGYWIIVVNRFLSGTRAVVSFFAGMSELNLVRTTILCFLSALVWNAILMAGGFALGKNWKQLGFYLGTYSKIVTGIIILAAVIWLVRMFFVNRRKKNEEAKPQ